MSATQPTQPAQAFAGCGVAMWNAHTAVQAAADFITTANTADGVAVAIEKFVLA